MVVQRYDDATRRKVTSIRMLLAGAAATAALGYAPALGQSLQGTIAQGQGQTPGVFARDRNVSVTERPRPGYEALGLRAGGFMLWPKLTVANEYNDNIFATQNIRIAD